MSENQEHRGRLQMADNSLNHCRIMQADILSGTNGRRETPLHCILHLYPDIKLADIMPLLERFSYQINKTNCDGDTPLHVAVLNPSVKLEVVNEFLTRGANPNLLNNHWNTPLHIAVTHHLRMGVIQTLLKHMDRSNVDRPNKMDKTPLGIAVQECSLDVVKELTRFGADINRRNYVGESLLHAVKVPDDPEIVKLMLELGARVDATDRAGNTPLHVAAGQGHEKTLELLLKNGAVANGRNNERKNPLHFMDWRHHNSAAIVNLLVKFGADCCARDSWQRKPMYYAANACSGYGALDSMKALILHTLFKTGGEDVDIKVNIANITSSRTQGQLSRYRKACKRELVSMQNVVLREGISLYDVVSRRMKINEVVPDEDQGLDRTIGAVLRELCSGRYPKYHHVMLDGIQREWLVKVAMELEVYTVIKKYTPGCKRFRASLNRDAIEMISAHFTNRNLLQFIRAFSSPL